MVTMKPTGFAPHQWLHDWHSNDGAVTLSIAKTSDGFLLRFPDLADFAIAADDGHIGVWPAAETNEETLHHLLLDQVLPRVIAHSGRLVLHAGAVQVDDRAIAFIGETGSGKSTLTASFHTASYSLLSDDGLILTADDGCVLTMPTYPSLRLWPDAVSGVFTQPPALTPMAHYSTKQRIVVDDAATAVNQPLPLAALYMLAQEAGAGGVGITRLSARDACMAIIRNAFQLDPTDHTSASGLLAAAGNVAQRVPAFTLSYPRDFPSLPAVHAAILNQQALWAVCDGDDLDT
jgi:hypothetical protein